MRIVFDATALGSGMGGDETYLAGVLEGLAIVAPPGDEFPLFIRPGAVLPPTVTDNPVFPIRMLVKRPGVWHYAASLPRALAGERAPVDAVHCITHAPVGSSAPVALTVGDLSFRHHPEFYPPFARARLNALVPRQARRAAAVLAPSEFTRGDLIDAYGLDPDRVFVVTNRVTRPAEATPSEREQAASLLRERGVRDPYFLYLGNLHPRKNVPRLIEAFVAATCRSGSAAGCQMVIAGNRWWGRNAEERAASAAPPGSVVMLGRVGEAVRMHLLEHALALTYPSLFEGFGLPPIEAMALGTPVLASDRAAQPEVCGDAALLVDPTDVEAIAEGLNRLAGDSALRGDLRERGLRQAARFSTEVTGKRALVALEAAASLRRSAGTTRGGRT